MRAVGLVLVLLSLGLAGGVATHAVGGSEADATAASGGRCEARTPAPARTQISPGRMQIQLTPAEAAVEVVPLNTTGYNYADPTPAATPGSGGSPAAPASPAR
jgi:hypothetical protein